MRVLIAKKNQFHIDAITTWLRLNESCCEVLCTNCPHKCLEIFGRYQIDALVLGEDIHPKGQIQWLKEIKQTNLANDTCFIATASRTTDIDLFAAFKEPPLSIVHFNDAMKFFTSFQGCEGQNDIYLSPSLVNSAGKIPSEDHALHSLSPAEFRVASLVSQNLTNEEIADRLFLSSHTVSDHRKHIKEKLDISGGKRALIEFLSHYSIWLFSASIITTTSNKTPNNFYKMGGK